MVSVRQAKGIVREAGMEEQQGMKEIGNLTVVGELLGMSSTNKWKKYKRQSK